MGDERILYVDDDALMRRAFRSLLERHGFEVTCAASGLEAIAHLERDLWPVLVTDLRMPGMDGIALVEKARILSPATIAILVTGVPEIDLYRDGLADRVLTVIAKPWQSKAMARWVRRAVDLHRSVRCSAEGKRPAVVVHAREEVAAAIAAEIEAIVAAPCVALSSVDVALACFLRMNPRLVAVDASLLGGPSFTQLRRLTNAAPKTAIVVLVDDDGDELGRSLLGRARDYVRTSEASGRMLERVIRYAGEVEDREVRMAELETHDVLTGLPNRAAFCEAIREGIERGGAAAVLLVGVDRFESVNDCLGHAGGDAILADIGERLRALLPAGSEIARVGGDQFGVLMAGAGPDVLDRSCDVALSAFHRPFSVQNVDVVVTACVGAASYPASAPSVDGLFRSAEVSLRGAKRRGRNTFQIQRDRVLAPTARLDLERELREALALGRYVLHYQEQRDLRTGAVRGAEALLRMKRADGTLVSPAQFIPILEDSELIHDVGAWVIREACVRIAQWHRAGHGSMGVAVNLSARQFERPGLVRIVEEALAIAGIPTRALELEITEGLLMRDTDATNVALAALERIGVRIAIDDFGTGYSSLAYLHRFHVNAIKVDQSFVRAIGSGPNGGSIASSIIDLGHRLGLEVIAEGVETGEELAFLETADCDAAQGYHFARPIEGWLPEPRRTAEADAAPKSASGARSEPAASDESERPRAAE
jgi:diguanylate cyclase (GGDEF)-like protein